MGALLKMAGSCIQKDYKQAAETVWNLILAWKYFAETEVVVGIPEEFNVGREGGLTNSALLYLHENGVPSHNIPPRPVLEPALMQDDVKEKIELLMREGAEAALVNGDLETCKQNYEKAGMIGRDACRGWITAGTNLAPNAPSTYARKKKKGDNGKGEPIPLVDTGSMLGSINYAVRKK